MVDFGPNESANIYADTVVLMQIECQGCGTEFEVCLSDNQMSRYRHAALRVGEDATKEQVAAAMKEATLEHAIKTREIHYGDPPNTGCCGAGATMNSIPVRVLQFWRRDQTSAHGGWLRESELEVEVTPDWATDTSLLD